MTAPVDDYLAFVDEPPAIPLLRILPLLTLAFELLSSPPLLPGLASPPPISNRATWSEKEVRCYSGTAELEIFLLC